MAALTKNKDKGAIKMVLGYARISCTDQNAMRQIVALRAFGVPDGNIFLDKKSGKDFDRPAYQRLLKKLKPGDTLAVKSIDRLGRDYSEILEQWRIITKDKEVFAVVLDIPLLDTRQEEVNLTGTLIADLVLNILSYVAQQERESIRQRQAEGIAVAKARGVKFGRPPLEKPATFDQVRGAWERKEISASEASRRLNVNRMTFLKWVVQGQKTAKKV
jgi:DNA invertase Pin-like site-specific DNA recombinase